MLSFPLFFNNKEDKENYIFHDDESKKILCLSLGSIVDFGKETASDWNPSTVGIVNATNTKCLGGGGADGAINLAGGPALIADRQALPINFEDGVRIPTGRAVVTGPNVYGSLYGRYVIHAVGPNYFEFEEMGKGAIAEADENLASAYTESMRLAQTLGLEYIGFSLISAGIFRGSQTLEHVLGIAISAISGSVYPALKQVHLICFNPAELTAAQNVACEMFS